MASPVSILLRKRLTGASGQCFTPVPESGPLGGPRAKLLDMRKTRLLNGSLKRFTLWDLYSKWTKKGNQKVKRLGLGKCDYSGNQDPLGLGHVFDT